MSLLPPFALNTFAITLSARLPLVLLYCNVATEGVRRRGGLSGLTSWSWWWASRSQLNVHSIAWNTVKEKIVVAIFCGDFCIKSLTSVKREERPEQCELWPLLRQSFQPFATDWKNENYFYFFWQTKSYLQRIESTKTIFFNKLNPTRNGLKAQNYFF